MIVKFSKYQGAGNDFILIDNREGKYDSLTISQIQFLCDRKFGIGADGLIKINHHSNYDFEADYYNADGSKSFCGNGGRCAIAFCSDLGMDVSSTIFLGYDGEHKGNKINNSIHLGMKDVSEILKTDNDFIINTGSPHYIRFISDVKNFNIYNFGREIRYSNPFKEVGINVNAVEELAQNNIYVRTYERGVENETLACGTGVTACAMAYVHAKKQIGKSEIRVKVEGGELAVHFNFDGTNFSDVWLIGPGTFVFEGSINV